MPMAIFALLIYTTLATIFIYRHLQPPLIIIRTTPIISLFHAARLIVSSKLGLP